MPLDAVLRGIAAGRFWVDTCRQVDLALLGLRMADETGSEQTIEVVYSAQDIASRIDALAGEVLQAGLDDLLVIAVLKGSFVFAADLIRALHRAGIGPEVDFISLSSYGERVTSSGAVEVLRDIEMNVTG